MTMRYFYLRHPADSIRHCQTNPVWRAHVLETADKSLSNTFVFSEKYEMERCTVPVTFSTIDWDHIPFGDEEWCYAFNRHTFLLKNAETAAITGDRKYVDNWIRLFEDFFTRSHLSEKTKKLSWRSLECGIRIENYIRSLEILNGIGMELPSSVIEDIREFFRIHINYLMDTHTDFYRLSNWGILQDHGLFLAALYLDDIKSAHTALERLDDEMSLQTLPDGMHWEQSSMYHAEVLHCALDTLMVADRNKIGVPDTLRHNTKLLALGLARSIRPDGRCYLFGDSDEIDMRDMIASAAVLFSDHELSYYAEGGIDEEFWLSHDIRTALPSPQIPEQRSYFFKDSGNAFIRLSDDTALRFHCGLVGSGHGHIDQLHFDLYTGGTAIITDTGRYTYTDCKERYALKGAHGHNTIILNGKEPSEMKDSWEVSAIAEPLFSDALMGGEYCYLRASHCGYTSEGAFITRSIITAGDRFLIIADDVTVSGETEAEVLFHFDCGTEVSMDGNKITARNGKSLVKMQFPADTEITISEYPISKRYNELLNAPLLTCKAKVAGRKCLLTFIGIGNDDFHVTHIPVVKALTGTPVPQEISQGLIIEDSKDRYSIGIITNEYPAGGFLLRAGDAEAFGKVFISKNNGKTTVLRY